MVLPQVHIAVVHREAMMTRGGHDSADRLPFHRPPSDTRMSEIVRA